MPRRQYRAPAGVPGPIRAGFVELKESLDVPDAFPDAVLAEAEQAASAVELPERDLTDVAFVTIDPPGSTDLDQALFVERAGDGYRVLYAIADLMSFVTPGGAIDAEAHARGVTLYAPHERTPLHPPVLAEGAASLLAGQVRTALVWEHTLDAAGVVTHSTVARARVRSRAQLDYAGVQADLDAGTADEVLVGLREVGLLRLALEVERGAVSLNVPSQEVHATGPRRWELSYRAGLPVEDWNAQISLMTGMAAAQIMLDAGVGILRTLPPAEKASVDRLRRVAKGLRIRWPGSVDYPEFVRSLDPTDPRHAAMLNASTLLFRGAGYAAFDGERPEQPLHGAMRAPYAHCTAPLRRLVDRYVSQICLSVCAGEEIPGWVREELFSLPDVMADALRRANAYERGIVGLVEALVLSGREGEEFAATVISIDERRGGAEIQIEEPAVQARLTGEAELGSEITAELVEVDLAAGRVEFRAR
ncbi:RNB domain-containing ribonuclease [Propioniciclava soli]|uniref:RNB domain-containing ribonuclease n=1 Tax=Propioniciclava soli TaxID=2775081 RepID=A0ABZ3C4S4_9ACTN